MERVEEGLGLSTTEEQYGMKSVKKLFVYGTLMTKERQAPFFGTRYEKEATLKGTLIDLVRYPGYLNKGDTVIKGELLEITDETGQALESLDRYEGFRHDDPQHSLYVRAVTETLEGDLCYVYVYNLGHDKAPVVEGGDWHNRSVAAWEQGR